MISRLMSGGAGRPLVRLRAEWHREGLDPDGTESAADLGLAADGPCVVTLALNRETDEGRPDRCALGVSPCPETAEVVVECLRAAMSGDDGIAAEAELLIRTLPIAVVAASRRGSGQVIGHGSGRLGDTEHAVWLRLDGMGKIVLFEAVGYAEKMVVAFAVAACFARSRGSATVEADRLMARADARLTEYAAGAFGLTRKAVTS